MKKLFTLGLMILTMISFSSSLFSQTYKSFIGEKYEYVINQVKNNADYATRTSDFSYTKYDDGSYNVSIKYPEKNSVYTFSSNDFCIRIIVVLYDPTLKTEFVQLLDSRFSRITNNYVNSWYQPKEDFYVIYDLYDKYVTNNENKTFKVLFFDTYISTTKTTINKL
jgi:hypothetical protein